MLAKGEAAANDYVGSWFQREQKNYTSLAKTTLEEILLSISIVQDGITVTNSKIKSVDGEVENEREGKERRNW